LPTRTRLGFIDALRGIAAIYVVIFHIVKAPVFHLTLPSWLRPFIFNGSSGVALFFILSGFTLCYTYHPVMSTPGSLKKFYIRRFFRIAPLYYVILIFMTVLILLTLPSYLSGTSLFLNATFTFNLVPGYQAGIVPASWTIGIEMLFYLLFPVIFTRFCSLKKSVILLIFSSTITAVLYYFEDLFPAHYIFYLFLTNLPLFIAGFVCYFLLLEKFSIPAWVVIGIMLLVMLVPYIIRNPSFFVMAPFYALLILALGKNPLKIIVNKTTVFYGMLSYSVYLLHPKIVSAFGQVYKFFSSLGYDQGITYLFCIIFTLLPLTLLAYLTYRFIEKPGIRFSQGISKNMQ